MTDDGTTDLCEEHNLPRRRDLGTSNCDECIATSVDAVEKVLRANGASVGSELQLAASPVVLYDAEAQQRIPFLVEHGGENFEVAYLLDAQTDSSLCDFDRLLDRRLIAADQKDTGERNAIESIDKSFEANVWLFNDRALSADGFGDDGLDLPADWKEMIDDEEKAAVIESAYLAAQVMPLPIATPGKRLPWNYRKEISIAVIRLKALFAGNELILTHELNQPTADQIATYKSIQKERWIVQGTRLGKGETRIPPKARKLGVLYDALVARTSGYAGRVPLHHKMLVVMDHLSREVEAVRKN